MIFADIEYESDYGSFHEDLVTFVEKNFSKVRSGLQGDSWVWILDGDESVAIDTFSSMKHQVKSKIPGKHVQRVIEILRLKYLVRVYDLPELEAHEED